MKYRFLRHVHLFLVAALIVAAAGISLPVPVTHAAGSIIVNSNVDDTLANLDANATCDLREAIVNANNDAATYSDCAAGSGVDTITFAGNYTITLVDQLPSITTKMSITGNGADNTIIQANAFSGVSAYRVLQIEATGDLLLTGVNIRNGRCAGACPPGAAGTGKSYMGGGIFNEGGLTVVSSLFDHNAGDGGAIVNNAGLLWVGDSHFISNSGGAIWNFNAPYQVLIVNSVFSWNATANYGGAINSQYSAPIEVLGTTFSNNVASKDGGAIYTSDSATISNSTFFQNIGAWGGGIFGNDSTTTITIRSSTFSENSAVGGFLSGASIWSKGALNYANTVMANSKQDIECRVGSIPLSVNNMVEDNSCPGTNSQWGDPKLGTLELHNGFQTIIPLPGSALIDTGDDSYCAAAPVNNVDQRGVARPIGTHCDIGAYEKDAVFADVPLTYWANNYVERLYYSGITGGCSVAPLNYCPSTPVTRAQMAVFLVRGMHGVGFTPPTATGIFSDVPVGSFGANYIEQLAADGITSGCGGGKFCPSQVVTRAQMAVFLVRASHGIAFIPSPATGVFSDVPVGSFGADYIEQLVKDGITSGCTATTYCPNSNVRRDSMSVLLVRTFNLP